MNLYISQMKAFYYFHLALSPNKCLSNYIYKSYMGYRPGGVTGRVAGAKWQGQNEFHVEEPTKAII